MLSDIKEELLKDPEKIVELLEEFDFQHISFRNNKEIRFARNEEGGKNISIRLENNDCLYVSDWARSINTDIFSYIITEKRVAFRDVLLAAKRILGFQDDWKPKRQYKLFGGIFENIGKPIEELPLQTYPEEVLNKYDKVCSHRWLKEGLTLQAQRFYDVCFDDETNRICFPWRDQFGNIISIKGRINEDEVEDDVPKYLYLIKNSISRSLFNYSSCYEHLYNADKIFLFESEKSCIKAFGWGIKNTLAIGSHSLSQSQIKLLLQLQPHEVCFMFDSDLDLKETKKNADAIMQFVKLREIKLTYWNWQDNLDLGPKSAPVDGSFEDFKWICENEIYDIKELEG